MTKMNELYEKVAGDKALQTKLSEIMEQAKLDGEETASDKLIMFAKDAGYEITLDEMKAYFEKMAESTDGSLSDSELDMVAGGKGGAAILSIFSLGIGCIIHSIRLELDPMMNCENGMKHVEF